MNRNEGRIKDVVTRTEKNVVPVSAHERARCFVRCAG